MRRVVSYIFWVVCIIILALAFVFTGATLLLAATVLVAVLPLLGLAAVSVFSRSLGAELESPTSFSKEAAIPCEVLITNASWMPFLHSVVVIEIRNLLTGQLAEEALSTSVLPRSTVSLPFVFRSDLCGRMECRVKKIRCFEPLGLFSRTQACDASRRLSIMPTLHTTLIGDILSVAPLSDTATYSPHVKGNDASEVFALREYEEGDEIRHIHWKLSSKLDELIVREPSLPLDNSLLVFWDKGLYGQDNDPLRADALAEAVLGICENLSSSGIAYEAAFNDVSEGKCQREYVSDENDIYELIGRFMSTPLGETGESGIDTYVRIYGTFPFSRIIYISCGLPPKPEQSFGNRQVMALVCDDDDTVRADPSFSEIHFHKGDAPSALGALGVL